MTSLLALPQPSFGHLRTYAVSTEIENISKRLLTLYPTPLLVAILVFLPFYIAYFSVSHKAHLPPKSGKKSKPKRGLEENTRLGEKLPTGSPTEDTESTEIRVSKESVFPANWWSSDELFQLEKRAIFSKSWIYVTHISRFEKPGDYLSFEITDLPFFIILGKDNQLRAFHNGSSVVIGSCRYHGWSYNVQGALVNAPQFEGVEGFDKDRNSLFEIHTRTTKEGFIFVNFDASENATVYPQDKLNTAGLKSGIHGKWMDGWATEGRFNWKVALRKFVFPIDIQPPGMRFASG
ncbi:Rieske [2Fe-2S] iron-sulfur domain-containing protein [Tuber borchii]|uniref:Rieske [2Fe-2S] iron-sulfur domain-containing protein n=1 Tax=Tuber borchii TaxID=42251 RepID=A0A2T7A3G8_TUBBO|nr:Rieske [2Fe-2S] iron-sulfur domain-containing protein [Tuber borchii]